MWIVEMTFANEGQGLARFEKKDAAVKYLNRMKRFAKREGWKSLEMSEEAA